MVVNGEHGLYSPPVKILPIKQINCSFLYGYSELFVYMNNGYMNVFIENIPQGTAPVGR